MVIIYRCFPLSCLLCCVCCNVWYMYEGNRCKTSCPVSVVACCDTSCMNSDAMSVVSAVYNCSIRTQRPSNQFPVLDHSLSSFTNKRWNCFGYLWMQSRRQWERHSSGGEWQTDKGSNPVKFPALLHDVTDKVDPPWSLYKGARNTTNETEIPQQRVLLERVVQSDKNNVS